MKKLSIVILIMCIYLSITNVLALSSNLKNNSLVQQINEDKIPNSGGGAEDDSFVMDKYGNKISIDSPSGNEVYDDPYVDTGNIIEPKNNNYNDIVVIKPEPPSFKDINNTPYETSVDLLKKIGLLSGYQDGAFRPETKLTRAEFVVLVYKLFFENQVSSQSTNKNTFPDMPKTHFSYSFVNKALDLDIIKGYPDGLFHPTKNITYTEIFTVCIRILKSKDKSALRNLKWPEGYNREAKILGLDKGLPKVNYTKTNATRGHMANIIVEVLNLKNVVPINK